MNKIIKTIQQFQKPSIYVETWILFNIGWIFCTLFILGRPSKSYYDGSFQGMVCVWVDFFRWVKDWTDPSQPSQNESSRVGSGQELVVVNGQTKLQGKISLCQAS